MYLFLMSFFFLLPAVKYLREFSVLKETPFTTPSFLNICKVRMRGGDGGVGSYTSSGRAVCAQDWQWINYHLKDKGCINCNSQITLDAYTYAAEDNQCNYANKNLKM